MLSILDGKKRVEQLKKLMDPCRLCPRNCAVHRLSGECGFCRAGVTFKAASVNVHRGEEPPISAMQGSGTIFATYCTMKCLYCQNFPFSQLGNGTEMSGEDLADAMENLAHRGVHNFNFVTPTHFAPQFFEALVCLWERGVFLPVVYNTSGYESIELLRILDGMVDVYLPDIKYSDDRIALTFSKAADYVENNRKAVAEMYRQVGQLEIDSAGIAKKGLIIRHLVLPEGKAGTRESFVWLKNAIGTNVNVSLMSQYFPAHQALEHPQLARKITDDEYYEAIEILEELGFENVWAQDPTLPGGA